jgi:hypothetical protein
MQPVNSSSSNPVISWHNEFVGVRHAGYAALQQTLWQRSQDRVQARGEPAAAALFSKGLLQQLVHTEGKFHPGWIPGEVGNERICRCRCHCAVILFTSHTNFNATLGASFIQSDLQ